MAGRTGRQRRRRSRPIRWLTLLVGVAYLTTLAVNRSLVIVRGPSMEPSLWPGDRLLTIPARRWWVRPGQVVVVAPPEGPTRVVKRVHHLERAVPAAAGAAGRRRNQRAWLVEVRGDAPERSTDSRWWGPLPGRDIRRVAVARWPDVRTALWRRPVADGASHRDHPGAR
jgi:signal peptidase I